VQIPELKAVRLGKKVFHYQIFLKMEGRRERRKILKEADSGGAILGGEGIKSGKSFNSN